MRSSKRHIIGIVALAMVCVMLGTAIGAIGASKASALSGGTKLEGVVTSPFTAAVEAVRGSVVGVSNYKTYQTGGYGRYFGYGSGRDEGETREVEAATGSGTVISAQGHVLTNYHVIEGASKVMITTEEKEYSAEVVAYDAELDIAILQAKDLNLPHVSLGDSDTMKIGDWAICIGNPLSDNLVGTTTVGVVSGLNRSISTTSTTDRYGRRTEVVNHMMQVDASINSGNSGGGMFNVLGELMGIPTIKYSSMGVFGGTSIEGIGMCIPINAAKPLIEKVLSGEITSPQATTAPKAQDDTPKPRMGISYYSLNGAAFDSLIPSGAYISAVEAGSPAEAAGLLAGDIIVEADGQIIGSASEDLQSIIGAHSEGDQIAITVYRAPGFKELFDRYSQNESIRYSEIPTDGEYIDLEVELKMLDEVKQ